ncbi:putative transcription factor B3-Domain family [Helianthus debilis subsp. tardiflorus]
MTNLSTIIGMDPLHNSPSFLKLIEEDFLIFLEIPNDFASMIWGDQPPYKDSVKIVDGNKLWFVRVKKLMWALFLLMASSKLFEILVMADEFWRQFYGKNFKGGQSTLYLGDRFWNVNMDGLTDSCVFTHGCSEMINDLALDKRSTFVFSMHGNKIFELLVFNHQTGTQIHNNRV